MLPRPQYTVFDQIENELKELKWPYPFDASGALRNYTTMRWEGKSRNELSEALEKSNLLDRYKVAMEKSDSKIITNYAGEGIGEINSIAAAYDIIMQIERDAVATIKRLNKIVNN